MSKFITCVAVCVSLATVANCGGGSGASTAPSSSPAPSPGPVPPPPTPPPPTPPPPPPPPPSPGGFGIDQRPTLAPLSFPTSSAQPGDIAVSSAFPNLPMFTTPLFFTTAPGDSRRAFVVTQNGVIYVFNNDPAVTTRKVFLDIDARVTDAVGEMGLLGQAFDRDYATNGFFYVNYNQNFSQIPPDPDQCGSANPATACRTVIARFHVTSNPDVADPNSETQLLTYQRPFMNHKGGWLGFGPDGKLYIVAGDGGSGGDPNRNAQNLNTLLGKMLRINSDGSIPSDNPFVGQPNTRGEIWAYGLRNPFRDSFDRATGQIWAGDVGESAFEEIDMIVRGGNYGWNVREGFHGYPTASTPPPTGNNFHRAGRRIRSQQWVQRDRRLCLSRRDDSCAERQLRLHGLLFGHAVVSYAERHCAGHGRAHRPDFQQPEFLRRG